MIHEEICTYEVCKLAKEKGFDVPTDFCYEQNGCLVRCGSIAAPTQSLLQRWLREEKDIHIEPCVLADADTDADGKVINEYTYWSFTVTNIETGDMIYFEYERIDDKRFSSYELALEDALKYALENLLN